MTTFPVSYTHFSSHIKNLTILFVLILAALAPSCTRIEGAGNNSYPADGISGGTIEIKGILSDKFIVPENIPQGVIDFIHLSGSRIQFKSAGKEGTVVLSTRKGRKITLIFYRITLDSDADGYPDASELQNQEDREAARNWMVRIAESQFLKKSPPWEEGQRDCAGLVRFVLKESLRRHDDFWSRKTGIVLDKNIADVRSFHYPELPLLGDHLFKIKAAPWDDMKSFSTFADAQTLIGFSMHRTGQSVEEASPGDCAVFENRMNTNWPYHMMIICGWEGMDRILIYHTGDEQGVKRVKLSYLKDSASFRPVDSNPNFIGVYRFNILD